MMRTKSWPSEKNIFHRKSLSNKYFHTFSKLRLNLTAYTAHHYITKTAYIICNNCSYIKILINVKLIFNMS